MKNNIEETIKALHDFTKEFGYWPTEVEWNTYAAENGFMYAPVLCRATNKTWFDYQEESGYPKAPNRNAYSFDKEVFTEEDCLDGLKAASNMLGKTFTIHDYTEWQKTEEGKEHPSATTITARLGRWASAMKQAGLKSGKRSEVFAEVDAKKAEAALTEMATRLGYWPTIKEWNDYAKEHGFLSSTSLMHYRDKTWKEIRKHFGINPKPRRIITEPQEEAVSSETAKPVEKKGEEDSLLNLAKELKESMGNLSEEELAQKLRALMLSQKD